MHPDASNGYTLGEIVSRFGGELIGDARLRVRQVAALEYAADSDIAFFSGPRYRTQLASTAAGAVIMSARDRDVTDKTRILCADPYVYFAHVSALLNPEPACEPGIHPTAVVEEGAEISPRATVGPLVYVGRKARIGAGSRIGAGCTLGEGTVIGDECRLMARVTVYHNCVIGDRVVLHSGVVIGADGFGMAWDQDHWLKIPQIGRVVIGDDVEIGANTTVDRGAMEDTVIGNGVKLDNLIMVAHNVQIGDHTAMAGCVGVAGSAKIGKRCTVGGAGMILGHLEIADEVNVSAGTLITKSITKSGTYTSAMPFSPHQDWLKNAAHLRRLDEMVRKIHALEQKIEVLERNKS